MHTYFFHLKLKQSYLISNMHLVAIIRCSKTPDVPPNSYNLWEEYALLKYTFEFQNWAQGLSSLFCKLMHSK